MVPVDFLGDAEVAAYGRFVGVPSVEELERFCFLDDVDRALIDRRREDHARLGFAANARTPTGWPDARVPPMSSRRLVRVPIPDRFMAGRDWLWIRV